MVFFSKKIILVKTQYKTHDERFLAIVEVFKTWRHYLEGYKHKVLIFTDHNNLQRFIYTKNLNFRQVQWAQKLSQYYFWINYWQNKANRVADALFWFLYQSPKKEDIFLAKNT